jgi:hypothetical protein
MELYCARLRCTFEGISFVIPLEIYRKVEERIFTQLRAAKTLPYLSLFMKMEQLFWDYLLLSVEFS